MATRFYLHDMAAPYTPATIRGAWDQTATAIVRSLESGKVTGHGSGLPTAGGTLNGGLKLGGIAETNAAADWDVLLGRWISGPMAAQTISGTFNVCIAVLESNAAANIHWHLHIYATQGDSDTPRGTLLSDYTEALGVNEWPTTQTFTALNAAQTLTGVTLVDGDRIVIELGYVSREASATSRTGSLYFGTMQSGFAGYILGEVAADGTVGVANRGAADAGFVTFSAGLTELASSVNVRLTQMPLEVLTNNAPSDIRIAQAVVQVLRSYTPDVPPATTPCAGGGTVASGSNPSAGASLTAATAIHKWLSVTIGATLYEWSDTAINITTAKRPRILSWGKAVRALTDGLGGIESAAMTIRLSDADRVLRGLHSTQTLLNKIVTVYAQDEASIRSGGNPWPMFTGVVRDFRPESELTYKLVLEDKLTLSTSAFAQEKLVPPLVVTDQISDATPLQKVNDSAIPLLYGALSDEDDAVPVGVVPASLVRASTRTGYESLGNNFEMLVGLGATADVQAVFIADPNSGVPPTARAKAGSTLYGNSVWAPHRAGWSAPANYDDYGGRRYTDIVLADGSQAAIMARDGKIPIAINLCGYETVGDGTGSTIDSLPLQLLHFLNNFVVQLATGNWLSIASLGSYSLFDTTTFAAVKTVTEARISGGYKGAFILGHSFRQITLRQALAQFCRSGDFDLGINRYGQIMLTILNRASTASSATVFTDEHDIIKDSFSIDPRVDEVENEIRYAYKRNYVPALQQLNPDPGTPLPREPFDGVWLSGLQTVSNAPSIAAIGETRQSQLLELDMVRDTATANDVAAQRLALRCPANGRAVATFAVTIPKGAAIELGDIVKVTHFQGLGASGWTAQRLQVRRIEVDLDQLTVELTCRDVHDLLA